MSLLQEIQDAAIDGNSDLETLLRKCQVLGSRLRHEELKKWTRHELDGYPESAELPEYRVFQTQGFGHFFGPFGTGLRNAPIAESCIPSEVREALTMAKMRQGVATLKDLVNGCTDGTLKWAWPGDASAMFGNQIYERLVLAQGWSQISKSQLVGILSTVRNRILSFALEIAASNPAAGEAAPNSTPIPEEKVTQIFNNNIYGNVGNFASGHSIQQSSVLTVQHGDIQSLINVLRAKGVADEDVEELQDALNTDALPVGGKFGKRVSGWLGKMMQKAAEGTWDVGVNVAGTLLAEALKNFYDI